MRRWCWVARDDLVWRQRLETTFNAQVVALVRIIIIVALVRIIIIVALVRIIIIIMAIMITRMKILMNTNQLKKC